jgi:hypothetical protein
MKRKPPETEAARNGPPRLISAVCWQLYALVKGGFVVSSHVA